MRSLAFETSSTAPSSPDGIPAPLLRLFEATREAAQSFAQSLIEGIGPVLERIRTSVFEGAIYVLALATKSWDWLGEAGLTWPALAFVAVILFGLVYRSRRRASSPIASGTSLAAYVRGPRRMGWATIWLFFGLGGGLAAAVPLASAALAPGVISPDGSRKAVQHLEGGIVRAIHIREGDRVELGQPLLTLEGTQARADLGELQERMLYLTAMEARMVAEQTQASAIQPPKDIAFFGTPTVVAAVLKGQQDLFESRIATQTGRESILAKRIMQLREESNGLREVISAQTTQLGLIQHEIDTVNVLLQKGLERVPRLLGLQRQQAELKGERANNKARIARNDQAIGQTEIELLTTREQHQRTP